MTVAANRPCPADRWIAGFEPPLRDALRGVARRRTFADRETVYGQGGASDGLYGIVEGRVSLVNGTAQGDRHLQLIALPGDWFGEMSTLDRQPRQQDATCRGPVVLLYLPLRDLERLGRRHGELWRAIGTLATTHQRMALEHMRVLVQLPVEGRVLSLLRTLAGTKGDRSVEITNEQIALGVGACRQTVNQAIRRLRDKGLLQTGYGTITLGPVGWRRAAAVTPLASSDLVQDSVAQKA